MEFIGFVFIACHRAASGAARFFMTGGDKKKLGWLEYIRDGADGLCYGHWYGEGRGSNSTASGGVHMFLIFNTLRDCTSTTLHVFSSDTP